jgi:hypothetical protein
MSEVGVTLVARIIGDQKLAAPGGAVFPVPITVPGDAEDSPSGSPTVLEQGRQDVGEMVLDPDMRDLKPLGRARRMEVGMEVGHDGVGAGVEEREEVAERLFKI